MAATTSASATGAAGTATMGVATTATGAEPTTIGAAPTTTRVASTGATPTTTKVAVAVQAVVAMRAETVTTTRKGRQDLQGGGYDTCAFGHRGKSLKVGEGGERSVMFL
ncbi:hypothetical protein LR48_Vigan07g176800 [Vigna angularis]|uniref:Uncharacterized protein n=1 Tax=Phaseolus angularis TaxID=3914 RepID=A0A0L9UZW0_PHAAN|nr:hypothetical protein LR48_Vigan07g176800 [Vigna angularis]